MKEAPGKNRVKVGEELDQEELQQQLLQQWRHGERTPWPVPVKYTEADDDWSKCKVCMDADIDSVILDCGHLVACSRCGKKLTKCPIWRQHVVKVHKVVLVSELDLAALLWELDLSKLSGKILKQVLTLYGNRCKDRVGARRRTVEEGGILDKVQKCKMCRENPIDSVFLPCGHMITCTQCGAKFVNCPICQKK